MGGINKTRFTVIGEVRPSAHHWAGSGSRNL